MLRGLAITDMHLRETDLATIRGYVENNYRTLDSLERIIDEKEIDILFFMSDIFDKGYRDIPYRESHKTRVESIVKKVKIAYNTIGNHLFKDRDANPEFYLIQPCSLPSKLLQPRVPIYNKEPVLHCVPSVEIEGVMFSFFHHDKRNKSYINPNVPQGMYHVGFYHDECMLPGPLRQKLKMDTPATTSYLDSVLNNVDFAVLADIHVKMGLYKYSNKTTMYIPGACSITSADYRYLHDVVDLPMFTIDNGNLTIEYVPLSTGLEHLKISTNALTSAKAERNVTKKLISQVPTYLNSENKARSFEEYVYAHKLPAHYVEVLDCAVRENLNDETVREIILRSEA